VTAYLIPTVGHGSRGISGLGRTWGDFESGPAKKVVHLQELGAAIGYGGMIHQFKNYIFRQDHQLVDKVQVMVRAANVALSAYRAVGVNKKESAALKTIGRMIANYADNLLVAEKMVAAGNDPTAVDKVVKIDDSPAFEAIAVLNKELLKARQASSSAVYAAVDDTTAFSTGMAVAIGILLGVLVMVQIWFTMFRLGRPLRGMVGAMGRLADGDLKTKVPTLGRGDEIGDMANAVQVFKDNAVRADRMAEEQKREQESKEKRRVALETLAKSFEANVADMLDKVTISSDAMESTAKAMLSIAKQTNTQSAAAEQASTNVQTVASAAEELSGSIAEIGRQVAQSSKIASRAVKDAESTNDKIQGLT